eukprot:TRINITY_DN71166_c0_g1_i1.p1 TRINITY_DN71166_c0_g1~~TRINITY_DN71166_c0_g1_i1.p1  ORF type:complete len:592 (+),score=147.85 TRINITY_DN71166_c0_g1_i1:50-1825(+)
MAKCALALISAHALISSAGASAPTNWSASCTDPMWRGCNHLAGSCCPNAAGEMLACCQETPVPGPEPVPVWGETVTISRVGLLFPEERVEGRRACVSREVKRSLKNPNYLVPIVFEGYMEASCPSRGFRRYEREEERAERKLPFPWKKHNVTVDLWTHETTWADTGLCVLGHCARPLLSVARDNFTQGVVSALGAGLPCEAKIWTCLGDERCAAAAKCFWPAVQQCGREAIELLMERRSRPEIECIWNCNGKASCVLTHCGKKSIQCLFDKQCIGRVMCFPEKMLKCSVSGLKCLLDKTSLCQDFRCMSAAGAELVASAEKFLADTNIERVTSCAAQHCERPVGPFFAHDNTVPALLPPPAAEEEASAALAVLGEAEEEEAKKDSTLACVQRECSAEWQRWSSSDADLAAVSTCPKEVLKECGGGLWNCIFTEGQCYRDLECLAGGLLGEAGQPGSGVVGAILEQLTDPAARAYDLEVYQCFHDCGQKKSLFSRALCYFQKCRPEVEKCFGDATCERAVFGASRVLKVCGAKVAADFRSSWQAHYAGDCMLKLVDQCANDVVEMLRDTNTSSVIQCAHAKCSPAAAKLLVI